MICCLGDLITTRPYWVYQLLTGYGICWVLSVAKQQQKDRGLTWNPAKLNFPKIKKYNLWPWQCFTRFVDTKWWKWLCTKERQFKPLLLSHLYTSGKLLLEVGVLIGLSVSWSNKYRSTQSHHPSFFDFRKVWVDQFSDMNWPSGKHSGWSYWQLKVATDKKKTHPKLNSKKLS